MDYKKILLGQFKVKCANYSLGNYTHWGLGSNHLTHTYWLTWVHGTVCHLCRGDVSVTTLPPEVVPPLLPVNTEHHHHSFFLNTDLSMLAGQSSTGLWCRCSTFSIIWPEAGPGAGLATSQWLSSYSLSTAWDFKHSININVHHSFGLV